MTIALCIVGYLIIGVCLMWPVGNSTIGIEKVAIITGWPILLGSALYSWIRGF